MDASRVITVPTFNRAVDEYFAKLEGTQAAKTTKQVRGWLV